MQEVFVPFFREKRERKSKNGKNMEKKKMNMIEMIKKKPKECVFYPWEYRKQNDHTSEIDATSLFKMSNKHIFC